MDQWATYPDYDYEEAGDVEDPEYADYYEEYDYNQIEDADPLQPWPDDGEGGNMGALSYQELVEYCVGPTVSSTVPHLSMLLGLVLVFTIAARSVALPKPLIHLLSAGSGLTVLYQVFGPKTPYLVGQVAVGALSLLIPLGDRARPWVVSGLCLCYLLACELWWVEGTVWHSIRGAQMIVLMKIVSYAHDESEARQAEQKEGPRKWSSESERHDKKEFAAEKKARKGNIEHEKRKDPEDGVGSLGAVHKSVEFLGYIFHPGTIIFGPWCSVEKYREVLLPMKWTIWWAVGIILNLLLSCLFLVSSTCFVTWLIPDHSNRWVVAYRDAASFRLSHYFVSHLSEASSSLGGLDVGVVSRAQHIELPRSLLSVVTFWNIPMHNFLKKYVFQRVRSVAGVWVAVLMTYTASAVIHGLNGQLCAVLLSLSVYTHCEHSVRRKLAAAFDACVLAKPCRKPCEKHHNTDRSGTAMAINLLMGAVCVWHLAYLGVMFDAAPSSATGYSLKHTMAKWAKLDFASHWAVLASYVFTALV